MKLTEFNRQRQPSRRARCFRPRLTVELLEARNLLDGGFTNVLVNDPTLDQPVLLTLPDGTTSLRPRDTQSETTLVLGSGNRVIVAYNDTGSETYFNGIVEGVGYSLSPNSGRSFQDLGTPPNNPYGHYSDPVLARSNRTGTIFLATVSLYLKDGTFVSDRINVYRSNDNGISFAVPQNGAPGFVGGVDEHDKEWLAVDNYPGPGYGNVYLAWRNFSLNKANDGFLLTRSTDDGVTWGPDRGVLVASPSSETQPGPPSANGAFVTVGPDHAVYVFYWDKRFLMRKSTDHGLTFGPAVTVSDLRRQSWDLGIGAFRADPFFQAAVNPVNGHLYAVYHDNVSTKDRADVYFRQSTDGGATWSPEVRVNDDATRNDQWSPALTVTPDGSRVGIFWYDRRLDTTTADGDPVNNRIDRYGVIGTVSGSTVTFGHNFRVSDVSFPPAYGQDPDVAPTYMGDYDQAVADNNYFYTTWGDNRLANPNYAPHVNQPDVRFAKIPVTGMAALHADSAAANPVKQALTSAQVQPVLDAALARWQLAAGDLFAVPTIDIRIADLGGTTLGLASGHTIYLDDNAAGWGWFVDPTPGDDSEFTRKGNQGEQNRMDLLTVVEHELGHLLGHEHESEGLMAETLAPGTRWAVNQGADLATNRMSADALFALLATDGETGWLGGSKAGRGRSRQ